MDFITQPFSIQLEHINSICEAALRQYPMGGERLKATNDQTPNDKGRRLTSGREGHQGHAFRTAHGVFGIIS